MNNQSSIIFHSKNQNKSNFIKYNDNVQIENKYEISSDDLNVNVKDNIWLSDLKDIAHKVDKQN